MSRLGPVCWRRNFAVLSLTVLVGTAGCETGQGPTVDTPATRSTPAGATASTVPFAASERVGVYLAGLARQGQLSGTVLAARGDQQFTQAYGLADRAASVPNTVQTRYRLGSVTKQFTAMAVLLLQQQHRLNITDSVCHYLPACPPAWTDVTLAELLTHSSGIPDYLGELGLAWPPKAVTPTQLVAEFRGAPLNFVPGAMMRYSNSGYALLGYVIERVTGQAYADFLQQQIFDPLGMTHTGLDTTATRTGYAFGYYANGDIPDPYPMSALYSAGGLYSTVDDLHRWDQALEQDLLVPASTMQQILTAHVPCPPSGSPGGCLLSTDIGYGYGWFIAHEPDGTLDQHVGRIDGFLAFNGLYPASQLHVIVLANCENTDVLTIARHVANLVLHADPQVTSTPPSASNPPTEGPPVPARRPYSTRGH